MIFIIILLIIILLLLFLQKKEKFIIKPSKIQGVGLFAEKDYIANIKLFKAIDNNEIVTYLGSKINHCNKPNTYLLHEQDGWYVYSKINIRKDEELIIDYLDTPNFIKKPEPKWKC